MKSNTIVRLLCIVALFYMGHIAKTSTDCAIFLTGAIVLMGVTAQGEVKP